MSRQVSPIDRIRGEIDDLFGSEFRGGLGVTLEDVARLGARLLLQSALEAEVTEFLGRNRYERRQRAKQARAGSRNGYSDLTIKTTAGPVTLQRPKLRGTTEAFATRCRWPRRRITRPAPVPCRLGRSARLFPSGRGWFHASRQPRTAALS